MPWNRSGLSLGIALTRIAGYPVDVRIINQAPVPFLFHVLRGQPLIVRDEQHLGRPHRIDGKDLPRSHAAHATGSPRGVRRMTLDADLVRRRCQEIAESIERLEGIRAAGRDEFLASADARDIACYRLLIAIEAALALCYHVSARRLRTAPEDYAGCFASMEKAGVIDAGLWQRLQLMARLGDGRSAVSDAAGCGPLPAV
jgi:uncharacterized protein YutE (UPF0331/DUF86 family)